MARRKRTLRKRRKSPVRWVIYGLIDPRSRMTRYVGFSIHAQERLVAHVKGARTKKNPTYKDRWLTKLLDLGLYPEMFIIEEVNDSNWDEKERFWIKFHKDRIGDKLTNSNDGGDGFYNKPRKPMPPMSDKRRKGIGDFFRGRPRGWTATPEHIEAIRKANSRPKTEQEKINIGNAFRGKKHTEEHIEKQKAGIAKTRASGNTILYEKEYSVMIIVRDLPGYIFKDRLKEIVTRLIKKNCLMKENDRLKITELGDKKISITNKKIDLTMAINLLEGWIEKVRIGRNNRARERRRK